MIETAIEITNGSEHSSVIKSILDEAHLMINHPVETLNDVRDTLAILKDDYRLVLITKGDLFDQERKLVQSGLGDFFDAVEVVSNKNHYTYDTIFKRHGGSVENAMMVGNSLKSDIIPALQAGAWGVYIPL